MNLQIFKTARNSSSSTKKSIFNNTKIQIKPKKNLQKAFTKMSVPGEYSSVCTQKNRIHDKFKGFISNHESQKTVRLNSNSKKKLKTNSKTKIDRKAEYTKLKAKMIQTKLKSKKQYSNINIEKQKKSPTVNVHEAVCFTSDPFSNLDYRIDSSKNNNFIQIETDSFPSLKQTFDSKLLQQMQKNQKKLTQKISNVQKQNDQLSQRNDFIINEIKNKHNQELTGLKDQMKILTFKFNQQLNKNTALEKNAQHQEKDSSELKFKLFQKNQKIERLEKENRSLEQELGNTRASIKEYENKLCTIEFSMKDIELAKKTMEQQLRRCNKQKQQIKENCIQVLSILRQQFGQELKIFL